MRYLFALWIALASPLVLAAGLEGKPAPALSLADASGVKRNLAEIAAERPTIVLFWASWCPYCGALMPHLEALRRRHGDQLAVVAVNVWEEAGADPVAEMRKRGYGFTLLLNGDKRTKAWGVKGTPGLYLINAAGTVVFDRNARPFRSAAGEGGVVQDRASAAARSARLWAEDLEREVTKLLPGG